MFSGQKFGKLCIPLLTLKKWSLPEYFAYCCLGHIFKSEGLTLELFYLVYNVLWNSL